MNEKKYDIALSFAGEDREYVEKVANLLKLKNINIFYDDFEKSNLWGKNLYDYLSDIYKNKAKYTIIFISEYYAKKLWTNHERESAQARAFLERKEYILPAKFDDTEILGIHETIGYIDLRYHTPEEFVNIIIEKLNNDKSRITKYSSYRKKTYTCPFCKSKINDDSRFCLGCKAEIVYGSTKNEREDNLKIGMFLGALVSYFIFIFLTNQIKERFQLDIYEYIHPFIPLAISAIIIILSGVRFMKKHNKERLKEVPRFFQKNMIG